MCSIYPFFSSATTSPNTVKETPAKTSADARFFQRYDSSAVKKSRNHNLKG